MHGWGMLIEGKNQELLIWFSRQILELFLRGTMSRGSTEWQIKIVNSQFLAQSALPLLSRIITCSDENDYLKKMKQNLFANKPKLKYHAHLGFFTHILQFPTPNTSPLCVPNFHSSKIEIWFRRSHYIVFREHYEEPSADNTQNFCHYSDAVRFCLVNLCETLLVVDPLSSR